MFENKMYEGIHYSRFAASWTKSGGTLGGRGRHNFRCWLNTLIINSKPIPEDVIREIVNFADNGKLELEENAKNFLKNLNNSEERRES